MSVVKVRAKEGRIARVYPGGPLISNEFFESVPNTSRIQRLLNVHGDLELEPVPEAKPAEEAAPAKGSIKANKKENS